MISHRADILKRIRERSDPTFITGYSNYTPEVLDKLNDMGYAIKKNTEWVAWFFNGKRHRDNGPAVESSNGNKWWYSNGNYHRIDGPAVEWIDGEKKWYLNGENINERDFYNIPIEKRERYGL